MESGEVENGIVATCLLHNFKRQGRQEAKNAKIRTFSKFFGNEFLNSAGVTGRSDHSFEFLAFLATWRSWR